MIALEARVGSRDDQAANQRVLSNARDTRFYSSSRKLLNVLLFGATSAAKNLPYQVHCAKTSSSQASVKAA